MHPELTLNDTPISCLCKVKYLGIFSDKAIAWTLNINYASSKFHYTCKLRNSILLNPNASIKNSIFFV